MTAADPQNQLREALMGLGDQMAPLYEAAEGQRAELERRGWSPTAAEAVALDILRGYFALMLRPLT